MAGAGEEAGLGAGGAELGTPRQRRAIVWRIRDRTTFVALRRSDRRVRRGSITVTWAAGDPAEPPRVAYTIGKQVGGATVRNRIRRRLRAIVRDLERPLGPGAWLIGAAPEVAKLSYEQLKAAVAEAVDALAASGAPAGPGRRGGPDGPGGSGSGRGRSW